MVTTVPGRVGSFNQYASPNTATREATTMRSPCTTTKSKQPLAATRESPHKAAKTTYSQKQLAKMLAQLLSRVLLFATPRTMTRQTPLSLGFPRQEY